MKITIRIKRKRLAWLKDKKFVSAAAVGIFALIGVIALVHGNAATYVVSLEAESGTTTTTAVKKTAANASNGQSVAFGTASQPADQDIVVATAGDIQEPVSDLHDGIDTANVIANQIKPQYVLPLGDLQYEDGSLDNFNAYYNKTWGKSAIRSLTYPSPGNHEYYTAGGAGYYQYFSAGNNSINGKTVTGPAQDGYYAYNVGNSWRFYSMNSEDNQAAQASWIASDMTANPRPCTLIYMHKPYWDYGTTHTGDGDSMLPVLKAFYDNGGDLQLTGHEHNYQRFKPVNPYTDQEDTAKGILSIVVGTGGNTGLYNTFGATDHNANNLVVTYNGDGGWGVLKLTLHPDKTYAWDFVPVNGNNYTDSGSGQCH